MTYINAYTWNLEKWYRWTYLQGGNGDVENRHMATAGGWTGRGALTSTHHHVWNRWLVRSAVLHRELSLVLCDDLEGWDGWGWGTGREVQEGRHICVQLIHFIAWQKPVQHCKTTIPQFKKKKKKELSHKKRKCNLVSIVNIPAWHDSTKWLRGFCG